MKLFFFSGLWMSLSNGVTFKISLYQIVCTMDLIAKAQFLNMTQHNGRFGCKDCLIEGSHLRSGKGYAYCYSYEEALKSKERDDISFTLNAINSFKTGGSVCYFSIYLLTNECNLLFFSINLPP